MSTDDLKPCPLCGSAAEGEQWTDAWINCTNQECWFACMDGRVPREAWQALPRHETMLVKAREPDPPTNKNHHALHLVAERWERLDEPLAATLAPYEAIAQAACLMAETCRAIASTTCELYAPGQAGTDPSTTCTGRGLPECATCNALDVGEPCPQSAPCDRCGDEVKSHVALCASCYADALPIQDQLQVNPWPRPRPTEEPKP